MVFKALRETTLAELAVGGFAWFKKSPRQKKIGSLEADYSGSEKVVSRRASSESLDERQVVHNYGQLFIILDSVTAILMKYAIRAGILL